MNNKDKRDIWVVASNKKAQYDYFKEKAYECGVVLKGKEVKAIRDGKWSLKGSYATVKDNEVWLLGSNIAIQDRDRLDRCESGRDIKLLLNKNEIREISKYLCDKGKTLVVSKAYIKDRYIKCELWAASGKHMYDKRQSIANRDSDRRMQETLKNRVRYTN